jgi:hypothetical protein
LAAVWRATADFLAVGDVLSCWGAVRWREADAGINSDRRWSHSSVGRG